MATSQIRPTRITSRNHPLLRSIRGLHTQAERERTGTFLLEGVRFLSRAVEQHAHIESLIVAPELLTSPHGKRLVRTLYRTGVRHVEVTPEVLHSVAQSDDPQGVAAVVRQDWAQLESTPAEAGLCWVALSTVQSSGNLGTLVRTCEAVGAAGVIFLSPTADPYDASAVRSSMGALFSLRFVRASAGQLLRWKARHRAQLVGTSPAAARDYQEVSYRNPVILFMGWERRGLNAEEQALCDELVRIPMTGKCDSLNLAVATSLMLYEVFNQRRHRARTKAANL